MGTDLKMGDESSPAITIKIEIKEEPPEDQEIVIDQVGISKGENIRSNYNTFCNNRLFQSITTIKL